MALTRSEIGRRWRKKHPEAYKKHRRKLYVRDTFGISLDEYNARLAAQENICALCKEPFGPQGKGLLAPCLDHDHKTGKFRQFIHRQCNTAIGCFTDSPVKCRLAAEYLERHQ